MAQVIAKQQEIVFDVEPAPEPEPAVAPEPEPEPEPEKEKNPSAIDKLKNWINSFMKEDPND